MANITQLLAWVRTGELAQSLLFVSAQTSSFTTEQGLCGPTTFERVGGGALNMHNITLSGGSEPQTGVNVLNKRSRHVRVWYAYMRGQLQLRTKCTAHYTWLTEGLKRSACIHALFMHVTSFLLFPFIWVQLSFLAWFPDLFLHSELWVNL